MFLADGFEEVEALAPYDVLVRGGVNVKTVCLNEDNFVTSSHKTVLLAKYTFKEFLKKLEQEGTSREDVMIFPGGMPGSTNLAACKPLMELLRRHYDEGGRHLCRTVRGPCFRSRRGEAQGCENVLL